MRIFLSYLDETGSKKTTRLNLPSSTSTSTLIKQICKQVKLSKNAIILKLKYEPYNLRILDNLPINQYPLKNGSVIILQKIDKSHISFTENLSKIEQDQQEEQNQFQLYNSKISYSSGGDHDDSAYLEECLNKMHQAVRKGNLELIAMTMKQEPEGEEKDINRIMKKKNPYLLNELGDCGRNSLHWAIQINNADMVSFLIIKGADPTTLTLDDYSPLQLAVQMRSKQIMECLLHQKKLDINQVTSKGSALHLAVINEDVSCLEILLQNEADAQVLNKQKMKPIDVCKNEKISQILMKKTAVIKMKNPHIAKGNVYKVSSLTKSNKQRTLIVNPFKNQLIIQQNGNQVQLKISIKSIKKIEKINDVSFMMSKDMCYFVIQSSKLEKELLLCVKHKHICRKWIQNISLSISYVQNMNFKKAVPAAEQVIQVLDDYKNEIKLHKRKVENSQETKPNRVSIMDLNFESESQFPIKYHPRTEDTDSFYSSDDFKLRESDIILGSVIENKSMYHLSDKVSDNFIENLIQNQFKKKQFHSETKLPADEEESTRKRFRKKSEGPAVQTISKFTIHDCENTSVTKQKANFSDFNILNQLGTGSFGQVYLASHRHTKKIYALKVLNKKKLMIKKQLKYAVGEANILKKVNCPFIVRLYYAFQTPTNLYMALDNCSNGDLSEIITLRQKMSEPTSKFIIAQVIIAVQYLHSQKILYRDLKPENILIDSDGYVKLTDFGLSRENNFASSFCGSPAYLSPEMLDKKGVGFSTDIYGIGCVLYQMLVGEPPFFDEDMDTLFQNIKTGKLKLPSDVSSQAKSILTKLLEKEIDKRLGVKNFSQIKKHPFFKSFNWKSLEKKIAKPPKQMFINGDDSDYFGELDLDKTQGKALFDADYTEQQSMISKVKNFSFIRRDDQQ